MALLKILGILLVVLMVLMPLLKRFGKPMEPTQQATTGRWLMILMGVSALLATARYLDWI